MVKISVGELYKICSSNKEEAKQIFTNPLNKKLLRLRAYNSVVKLIENTHMEESAFYSVSLATPKNFYLLELQNGFKIEVTLDCKFLTGGGYQTLKSALKVKTKNNDIVSFETDTKFAYAGIPILSQKFSKMSAVFSEIKNLTFVGKKEAYNVEVFSEYDNYVVNGFIIGSNK